MNPFAHLLAVRTPSDFSRKLRSREAFTLIELLIVVAILGILVALLSGAILRSVENGRKQRRATEIKTLGYAITLYWHDYNRWPHKEGEEQSKGGDDNELRIYTTENWKVFNRLAAKNEADNPLGKAYLDETTHRTTTENNGEGGPISLYKKRKGKFTPGDKSTLVDYKNEPYKVTIDLELNSVKVE